MPVFEHQAILTFFQFYKNHAEVLGTPLASLCTQEFHCIFYHYSNSDSNLKTFEVHLSATLQRPKSTDSMDPSVIPMAKRFQWAKTTCYLGNAF